MITAALIDCPACTEQVTCWCENRHTCAACNMVTAPLFNRDKHRVWCPTLADEAGGLDLLQGLFESAYSRLLTNQKDWRFFGSQAGRYPGKNEKLDALRDERTSTLGQLARGLGMNGEGSLVARIAERYMEQWVAENRLERI